jgi:hypothetical protein
LLVIHGAREVVGQPGFGEGKFEAEGDFENLAMRGFGGQDTVAGEEADAVESEGVGHEERSLGAKEQRDKGKNHRRKNFQLFALA